MKIEITGYIDILHAAVATVCISVPHMKTSPPLEKTTPNVPEHVGVTSHPGPDQGRPVSGLTVTLPSGSVI